MFQLKSKTGLLLEVAWILHITVAETSTCEMIFPHILLARRAKEQTLKSLSYFFFLLHLEPFIKWYITGNWEPMFRFGCHGQHATHTTRKASHPFLPALWIWSPDESFPNAQMYEYCFMGQTLKSKFCLQIQEQWNCVANADWGGRESLQPWRISANGYLLLGRVVQANLPGKNHLLLADF